MKVLLTGAGGQLGQALIASAPEGLELVATSRQQLDLADPEACRGAVEQHQPDWVLNAGAYTAVDKAESEGCKVFIGMAGVAAALPGVIASMTSRPVIGVPVGGKVPLDSLLSIVQMPPGMPVATVGVDRGDNAGALAIQILACSDSKLAEAYSNFRTEMTEKVISDDNSIQG